MQKKQAQAKLRSLRVAPRKVRLLIDLIRGMKVEEAKQQLQFSRKDAAKPVLKLLNSAIANAVNNFEMKEDSLVIKTAYVDGGPIMYRWMPRAMGRATPIRKRTSHITLILEGDAPEKSKVKAKSSKDDVKEEETTTEDAKTEKKAKSETKSKVSSAKEKNTKKTTKKTESKSKK